MQGKPHVYARPTRLSLKLCLCWPGPRPHFVDASDLVFPDGIGERPRAYAKNIATVVDQSAGRFDSQLRRFFPYDMIRTGVLILDKPCHERMLKFECRDLQGGFYSQVVIGELLKNEQTDKVNLLGK